MKIDCSFDLPLRDKPCDRKQIQNEVYGSATLMRGKSSDRKQIQMRFMALPR